MMGPNAKEGQKVYLALGLSVLGSKSSKRRILIDLRVSNNILNLHGLL
jgi:hypothetical protein